MFGSHLSIAGGMHLALLEAERLGLDCLQVFTKNQQQWKAPPLTQSAIAAWTTELSRLAWQGRIVSHASYLANMGSPDDALREKSIALMRDEIERCEALGIHILVFHPGAHTTGTRESGVARIASAVAQLIRETSGYRTVLCLENVAGAGSHIGREFEELASLRAMILDQQSAPARVGFCIDSCHAHATGYDLSTTASALRAIAHLDATCGLTNVRALHLNDSKGAAGSRLDRHEHIAKGTIGAAGFAALVNTPAFAAIPKVMETPKGQNDSGTDHDLLNVRRLRRLVRVGTPRPKAGIMRQSKSPSRRTSKR